MPPNEILHDAIFPHHIAFGAQRTISRPTTIVSLGSGHEQRNQRWRHSRRKYDVGGGIRRLTDLQDVLDFFEARRGAAHPFRFRDPLDWKSCTSSAEPSAQDCEIGTGDGSQIRFALVKSYGEGVEAYQRPIRLPVMDTFLIAVAGVLKVRGQDYTFDTDTGEIVFSVGAEPALGEVVTAGFVFDVPVRFAENEITTSISDFKAGEIPSIELIEVLL